MIVAQLDTLITALGMQPVVGTKDQKTVAIKSHIGAFFP